MLFPEQILKKLRENGKVTDDDIQEVIKDHDQQMREKFWDKIYIGMSLRLHADWEKPENNPYCILVSKDSVRKTIILYSINSKKRSIRKEYGHQLIVVGVDEERTAYLNDEWVIHWFSLQRISVEHVWTQYKEES